MTKITEVEDRGATVAWSPVSSHADYLALGVKVSTFGRGALQNAIYVVSSDAFSAQKRCWREAF